MTKLSRTAPGEQPKVSCLMVTANRKSLMQRSIRCYNDQTYPNKEMVIVDDGEQDLSEVLTTVPEDELVYVKLEPSEDNTLGKLRNVSLDRANGDYLVQWDDDDWYHPERIAIQAEKLNEGYDACCLTAALMHLDTPRFVEHPYVGTLPEGVPGSIMHRNSGDIRYPHTRRAEDTVYLKEWMEKRYTQLPESYAYLFIRCFHGSNTWEKEHFLRRFKNNPADYLRFLWYQYVRGDLFAHPRFRLTDKQAEAFRSYLDNSRQMKLVTS